MSSWCRVILVACATIVLPHAVHAATLEAPSGVRAVRGETVSIAITVRAMGETIVATQNDLGFGPNSPVAALPDGRPDCAVNPALDKEAAIFGFQPPGCGTGTPCTAIRAVVVSLVNLDPIPDGAVVYTCSIAIPADAPYGSYPLTVDGVVLVDEEADELPGALGTDGSVIVDIAPTSTPTLGAIGMPTATPTSTAEPTPTATPVPSGCGGDCDRDGTVAINELIIGVGIALGALPLDDCLSFSGGDDQVGITDLVAAVNDALSGCAAAG